MLVACVDVGYRQTGAVAAALVCRGFDAAGSIEERAVFVEQVEPYQPGQFYLRELPCLRAVLDALENQPALIIVDGYVWLSPGRPGLGARLSEERAIPVIGVAKTPFAGAPAIEVLRGESRRPLFITAEGIDPLKAAEHVRQMHGPHRIPTLLKRVDALSRRSR